MATKVSIINFKGGVGKSTLAFHLAAHLAKNSRVLIIDVDHQSSLSIVLMSGKLWADAADRRRTCNTIFESFCNRKVSMPGDEIVHRNPLHRRSPEYDFYPTLDLVPAQFELDDTEIELASTTVGSAMLSEWHKRTLMAEWLDLVRAEEEYDYVVFDCPPATKLVSQNAIAASDYFVIPVIPDAMSSRGVTHFRTLVADKIDGKLDFLRSGCGVAARDVPKAYTPVTQMAAIAPLMGKPAGRARSGLTNIHTEQLAALRRQWGNDLLGTVVRHMTGVAEAMDAGWPVWNAYRTQNIRKVIRPMREACAEIRERIDA
ncbi:MAG: AAA family ATPase [Cenarchaeum sp. SB0669_bin_11]|nr:AAA family ATPase [Acidobacteriota bacterium]MYH21860.1 AAA family ATPase [Acidobacteriota bacterium]MYL11495.1 AAA family ATPase [Cenarchaeum sp. SB0669_bin_11]